MFIKTFHAAAVYILRRYGERIGVHSGFSIYDQSDQASLIKEILKEMRLDPKKIRPESIASKISEIKDRAEVIDGADPALLMQKNLPFDFPEIYTRYHEGLNRSNALDFNDLLIKTVALLREDPAYPGSAPAAVELLHGGRVPGHQLLPVPYREIPCLGQPQHLRGRRRRPVYLLMARRGHPRIS